MITSTVSRRLALCLVLGLTTFSACKKDTDVTPKNTDLGTVAAGRYTLTELSSGGKTVTAAQADLTGTISITRQTETSVGMAFDIHEKSTGDDVLVGTSNGLTLSGTSDAISIKGTTAETATLKGNKLSVIVSDGAGTTITLVATK